MVLWGTSPPSSRFAGFPNKVLFFVPKTRLSIIGLSCGEQYELRLSNSMNIQTWVFGSHFLKIIKVSLWLQGKQLKECVASVKIWAWKEKLWFWNTCIHHELDGFPVLKGFSIQQWSKCDFWYWIRKYINTWNICITHWTRIFQMINAWLY